MKKKYSYIIATFLITIFTSCGNGNAQKTTGVLEMQTKINDFSKQDGLKNASIGFLLVDLKTGKEIANFNPDMSLSPASTLKLFSTATALELFGDEHRFETKIQYDGTIDNQGILHGNIYIKGGGDPVLGSKHFEDDYNNPFFITDWVNKIKSLGITKIDGAIVGDAQYFSMNIIPRLRAWEDMANYYGIGACGLSIYDNLFEITLRSGPKAGDTTYIDKIEPNIPGIRFQNYVKASDSRRDEAFVFGEPYNYERVIRGSIPKASSDFIIKAALPDPAHFAALELENYLKSANIEITNPATTIRRLSLENKYSPRQRKNVHTTYSPTLSEIVNTTNKISYNLYPEHLLVHIGKKMLGTNDCESGTDAVRQFWASKGMDTDGMFMNDGSGLTRYNSLTARQFVFLLKYMKSKSKYYEAFNNSLPVAGKSGTLRNLCKGTNAADNVRAKSGSISKVRAYSGYVNALSGEELAFTILVNNYTCSDSEMRKMLEKLMVDMADLRISKE